MTTYQRLILRLLIAILKSLESQHPFVRKGILVKEAEDFDRNTKDVE